MGWALWNDLAVGRHRFVAYSLLSTLFAERGASTMRSQNVSCRSCGSGRLEAVLDLGETPIANGLVAPDAPDPDPVYPLGVSLCLDCALVQLTCDLPHDAIFTPDYPYLSSFSPLLLQHSRTHIEQLVADRDLGPDNFVIEVASNDGYLLQYLVAAGVPVLGIEPSPIAADAARARGVPTRETLLTAETALEVRADHRAADVVVANNVLAHVPNINDFFRGLVTLLADDGVLLIENPSVQYLVEGTLFDTIYHEHFSYLSTLAVVNLAERHGLYLNDVAHFPHLHGGTLRWTLSRSPARSEAAQSKIDEERELGLDTLAFFLPLSDHVMKVKADLRRMLEELRNDGKTVAAYGCSAKGATLLNTMGLTTNEVAYVVDRNPEKQGKAMPGIRLPCVGPDELDRHRPDVLLILVWNVADEVMAQQRPFAADGGRFLIPLPTPRFA
ncbi:MAG: methyltransferase domain-containing protein [Acidimicrobiales bacterium]